MARETLYLVDGSYYIFRAYYAIRRLSNSKGFPTNALFGFVSMLKKLFSEPDLDYLIVTFDTAAPTFRHEMFSEYKANRDAPPDDLIPQFPLFRSIVEGFSIPCLELEGYEADDVLGTLSHRAVEAGLDVVIITGDKDLFQLVNEHVTLWDTMREKRITPDEVLGRFQVEPAKVAEVLGLMGDSSDNIPGVRGVGEKTAGKLIAKYGSIEAVMDNLADFKGKKMGEKLAEDREVAFLSRKLATIVTDLDIPFDIDSARLSDPDVPALAALFTELEFTAHLQELQRKFGNLSLFQEEEPSETEQEVTAHLRLITSPHALDEVVEAIEVAGNVVVDLQSSTAGPIEATLVGIGLSWREGSAVYVPLAHDTVQHPEQLSTSYVLGALAHVFEDPAIGKIGLHTKRDWVLLKQHGIDMQGVVFDVMLASYILDASRKSHSLESMAWDYLQTKVQSAAELLGTGARKRAIGETALAEVLPFAAGEAHTTVQLWRALSRGLDDENLRDLHDEMELPLAKVLGRMERHGVLVDTDRLRALSLEFSGRMADIEQDIYETVGFQFNVNSPKQLAEVLFEKLQLPVQKRTKTGPSTDQSVLETLSAAHPVPAKIVSYRALSKLKSTYSDTLPGLADPKTHRIHTEFAQTVAATGRLSSNNPNLQNIPVRTDEGRRIREAFVAPEGMCLLSADYSQIELRLLAHMSSNAVLLDAFQKKQDIHARTASEIFAIEPDEITKEQRTIAKSINFGILYGMGPARLARELRITLKQAKDYIALYFERIAVRGFLDELVNEASETGYARTLLGRRRPLPELRSRNRGVRALGERLAVNTPLQGTAADLIKVAMVRLQERLDESELEAVMLLQVHDELVFEVALDDREKLEEMVVAEMSNAAELKVPLLVDVSHGPSWARL